MILSLMLVIIGMICGLCFYTAMAWLFAMASEHELPDLEDIEV